MKEMKGNSSSSDGSRRKANGVMKLNEVRAITIRKNKILSRLREYLQYSKLKHLLEAHPLQIRKCEVGEEKPMEVDMKTWEVPEDSFDEESSNTSVLDTAVLDRPQTSEEAKKNQKESCNEIDYQIKEEEEEEEEEEESQVFIPSIKIKRIDDLLLISALVLKDLALTSSLFSILEEEEKLDILSENQYRTETKVAHTIQVKVEPEYKVDELEKKLLVWASSSKHM